MIKQVLLSLVCLFSTLCLSAQQPNEVTLVVVGEGATKEEATNNALRSAVEQAFGVFVSANTEILNDQLIRDEIATVSSGNIKSFKEIAYVQSESGTRTITLETVVSIGRLIEYSKNHGSKAEFAGALFAANIKLQQLNADNELDAVRNYMGVLMASVSEFFDAEIKITGTPARIPVKTYMYSPDIERERSNESLIQTARTPVPGLLKSISVQPDRRNRYSEGINMYALPIKITFSATEQLKSLIKGLLDMLYAVSLKASELKEYTERNEHFYKITVLGRNFYFRSWMTTLFLETVQASFNKALGGKTIRLNGSSSSNKYQILSSYRGFCENGVLLSVFDNEEEYDVIMNYIVYHKNYTSGLYWNYDERKWMRLSSNNAEDWSESERKMLIKNINSYIYFQLQRIGNMEDPVWASGYYIPANICGPSRKIRMAESEKLGEIYYSQDVNKRGLYPYKKKYAFALLPENDDLPIEIVPIIDDGEAEYDGEVEYSVSQLQPRESYQFSFYLPIEQEFLNQMTSIEIE